MREHQRERLFAAMVALVAANGYVETNIPSVARLAGVSSRDAYALFPHSTKPKRDCFLAAVDELYRGGVHRATAAFEEEVEWEARLRAGLAALLGLIAEQPTAAHAAWSTSMRSARRAGRAPRPAATCSVASCAAASPSARAAPGCPTR